MEEGIMYCAQCEGKMKLVILPQYEFEEGITLHRVQGYKCPRCGKLFFTEAQAKEMEARTDELKRYTLGFKRKVTLGNRIVGGVVGVRTVESNV